MNFRCIDTVRLILSLVLVGSRNGFNRDLHSQNMIVSKSN